MESTQLLNRRYKLFLVEEDDYDRERVISALVDVAEIIQEVDNYSMYTDYSAASVYSYDVPTSARMKLNIVPRDDGTLFRVENFLEDDVLEDNDV